MTMVVTRQKKVAKRPDEVEDAEGRLHSSPWRVPLLAINEPHPLHGENLHLP